MTIFYSFRAFLLGMLISFYIITPVHAENTSYFAKKIFDRTGADELRKEIERMDKLLATSCGDIESNLVKMVKKMRAYYADMTLYYDNFAQQRTIMDEMIGPFIETPADAKAPPNQTTSTTKDINQNSGSPTLIDRYNALLKESKELKLFTDKDTTYVSDFWTSDMANWWVELSAAFETWHNSAYSASLATDHPVYFFERSPALSGYTENLNDPTILKRISAMAEKTELSIKRQAILTNLAALIKEYRDKRTESLKNADVQKKQFLALQKTGAELGQKLDTALNDLKNLTKSLEEQIKNNRHTHCFGVEFVNGQQPAALNPWLAVADTLQPRPQIPAFEFPDLTKIQELPVIRLKHNGVSRYLASKSMFIEQALVDIERYNNSAANLMDGIENSLSTAGTAIYETGKFFVDTGVMTADALAAFAQFGLNTALSPVLETNNWDFVGSVERTHQWTNTLWNGVETLTDAYVESGRGDLIGLGFFAVRPMFERLGEMLDEVGNNHWTKEQLFSGDFDVAQVRDGAAKMEQGLKNVSTTIGMIAGELLMDYALFPMMDHFQDSLKGILSSAKTAEKMQEIKNISSSLRLQINRLYSTQSKADNLFSAYRKNLLKTELFQDDMYRLTEILKKDYQTFSRQLNDMPTELQEPFIKQYRTQLGNMNRRLARLEPFTPPAGITDPLPDPTQKWRETLADLQQQVNGGSSPGAVVTATVPPKNIQHTVPEEVGPTTTPDVTPSPAQLDPIRQPDPELAQQLTAEVNYDGPPSSWNPTTDRKIFDTSKENLPAGANNVYKKLDDTTGLRVSRQPGIVGQDSIVDLSDSVGRELLDEAAQNSPYLRLPKMHDRYFQLTDPDTGITSIVSEIDSIKHKGMIFQRIEVVEHIPAEFHGNKLGPLNPSQQLAYEAGMREINKSGKVWLDNKKSNFAIIPLKDVPGSYQFVPMDPGGAYRVLHPFPGKSIEETAQIMQEAVKAVSKVDLDGPFAGLFIIHDYIGQHFPPNQLFESWGHYLDLKGAGVFFDQPLKTIARDIHPDISSVSGKSWEELQNLQSQNELASLANSDAYKQAKKQIDNLLDTLETKDVEGLHTEFLSEWRNRTPLEYAQQLHQPNGYEQFLTEINKRLDSADELANLHRAAEEAERATAEAMKNKDFLESRVDTDKPPRPSVPTAEEQAAALNEAKALKEQAKYQTLINQQHMETLAARMCGQYITLIRSGADSAKLAKMRERGIHCDYFATDQQPVVEEATP